MKRIFSNRFHIAALIASMILVLVALSAAAPAHAAGVVTNCTNDTDFSNKLVGGGTITFNCGTATIILQSTKNITADTIIDGDHKITLSGNSSRRLFQVNSGKTLDVRNLVLTGGYSPDGDGGTIFNFGITYIRSSTIQNSTASAFNGGAIANAGGLQIESGKFINNKAGKGGAIYSTGGSSLINIYDSEFYDNSVTLAEPNDSLGGAIYNLGSNIGIYNSSLHDNSADYGGAIYNNGGNLSTNHVTLTHNHALEANGGAISNNGTMTLASSLVSGNDANALGGGIHNVATATLNTTTVSNNEANQGGGIYNVSGTLNLNFSTIIGNKSFFTGDSAAGVASYNGTVNVVSSTIAKNTAAGTAGGIQMLSNSVLNMTNSTVSANVAGHDSPGKGGGLYISGSTANLTNVTFANNKVLSGTGTGGGIYNASDVATHLNLKNVALSKNGPGTNNCLFAKLPDTSDHNLSSDGTCTFTQDRDNVKLKLGKLETNGGATMTHRLLPGSPAIDNGVFVNSILTDQRSVTRPRGAAFDVGAVEFVPCNGAPLASTALAPANGAKINTPQVALDWAGPDCVKDYSVVVRMNKPSGAVVFSKTKLKLSQVTTGTLNPSKYVWQVTACNGSACTSSPWFKFKLQ